MLKRAWNAIAVMFRDRLGAWPYDTVDLKCHRCGFAETRQLTDCIAQYGADHDMLDLERDIRKRCTHRDCSIEIMGRALPSEYR